jgi:hypothetical protein
VCLGSGVSVPFKELKPYIKPGRSAISSPEPRPARYEAMALAGLCIRAVKSGLLTDNGRLGGMTSVRLAVRSEF